MLALHTKGAVADCHLWVIDYAIIYGIDDVSVIVPAKHAVYIDHPLDVRVHKLSFIFTVDATDYTYAPRCDSVLHPQLFVVQQYKNGNSVW
jgi:hypothetical protein